MLYWVLVDFGGSVEAYACNMPKKEADEYAKELELYYAKYEDELCEAFQDYHSPRIWVEDKQTAISILNKQSSDRMKKWMSND